MKLTTIPSSFSAIRQVAGFSKQGPALRRRFESVFADPLRARTERFCWDYWNVPGQYRLLRTPFETFFGPLGGRFLEELTAYGRERLGCQMISHPWMSVYLDGHFQNLHSDVPHGPWSFVYSLSPYSRASWRRRSFRGGETLVAKPKLLRYFRDLRSDESDEQSQLFESLPQPFNQLTLFDPRYPHGVSRVEGSDDLLRARVVIHGWFTEPRPMLEGALTERQAGSGMNAIAEALIQELSPEGYTGLLSLRWNIRATGAPAGAEVLAAHLTTPEGEPLTSARLRRALRPLLASGLRFPRAPGPTRITLPIEFRA